MATGSKIKGITVFILDSGDYFVGLNEHGGISFGIKGSHIFAIARHHPYYERLATVKSIDTVKAIYEEALQTLPPFLRDIRTPEEAEALHAKMLEAQAKQPLPKFLQGNKEAELMHDRLTAKHATKH